MSCNDDRDCAGNLICVAHTNWFNAQKYQACMCSGYFGYSGENCFTVLETPASLFWIVSSAILLTIGVLLIGYSLVELFRLAQNKLLGVDVQTIGTVQTLFGALVAMIAVASNVASALMPWKAQGFGDLSSVEKQSDYSMLSAACLSVASVLTVFGAWTIGLQWLALARRCNRMLIGGKADKFKPRVFLGCECIFLLGILIPILFNYKSVALFIAFVLQTCTFLVYSFGCYRIASVIRRMQATEAAVGMITVNEEDEYGPVLRRMYRSTLCICLCFVCSVTASCLMLVPMVRGWKNYIEFGSISMQVYSLQIIYLSMFLTGFEVVRFLRNSTLTKLKRRELDKLTSKRSTAAAAAAAAGMSKQAGALENV